MWEPIGCCFCFTRKTGSLIMGSLVLIGSLLNFLLCSYLLIGADFSEVVQSICTNKKFQFEDCDRVLLHAVIMIMVISVVLDVIYVIFSSMLIHGVRKRIPCLLTPFMVMQLIEIILVVLYLALVIGVCAYLNLWGVMFFKGILFSAVISLKMYFLLVIRAHYFEEKQSLGEVHRMLEEAPDNRTGDLGDQYYTKALLK